MSEPPTYREPPRRQPKRPPTPGRLDVAESWWPLIARVIAFFFGAYLINEERQPPPGVEEWIIFVGVACMGPTIATTFAVLVESIRGVVAPPEPPPSEESG